MSYTQLTLEERFVIYHLRVLYKLSVREIAHQLDRHHSTISRELRRNASPDGSAPYGVESAQRLSLQRRQQPRHRRCRNHSALYRYVMQGLQAHWSPQIIAGRLPLEFPGDASMRISHEAIYGWIYRDAKNGGELYRCLPYRHRRRRKQRRYGSVRGLIPGRVSIQERPAVVERRSRFGDWEGDTVYGHRTRDCLLTTVERKSRYVMVSKIPDRCADTVAACHIESFCALPSQWRKTLTLDNGKEFAQFNRLEEAADIQVFFADPYSAWQRGANENTNGLLRRYYPKGTDFSQVSDEHLASVVENLNNRPRKCLAYRTPAEVMQRSLGGALRC